jgi:hypothetical protein
MGPGQLKRSLVEGTDVNVFIPVLTELSNLNDTAYAIVANAARSVPSLPPALPPSRPPSRPPIFSSPPPSLALSTYLAPS